MTGELPKTKIVYCDCCESAWIKVLDKDQETDYVCSMCQESVDRCFVPNSQDTYDAIDRGN